MSILSVGLSLTTTALHRSESKTGLDNGNKKHGAGPNNWGSYAEQVQAELYDDDIDALSEEDDELSTSPDSSAPKKKSQTRTRRASSNVSEADRARARTFRTGSFKARDDSECFVPALL